MQAVKSKAQFYYKDTDAPKPNQPNSIGTSVLIVHEGKLLLEHRQDSDNWAIIGGKLEVDEDLASGAIREVLEETGILLSKEDLKLYKIYDDPSRIASYPDGNIVRIITVVYHARLKSLPELVCSEESRELRFFNAEELREVQLARTHVPILEDYLGEMVLPDDVGAQELLEHLEQLHTTEQGAERIRRNLRLSGDMDEISAWCAAKARSEKAKIYRKGKNWYVQAADCEITINAKSFTIITAHRIKA